MDILGIIVTPISGAVIGYFTNWLAIKMLFRPHEEKRLFGIKMPMTPGLIPKERLRISKTIGESMSKNILTEDELKNAITSPEIINNVEGLLEKFLEEIRMGAYESQIENLCALAAENTVNLLETANNPLCKIMSNLYEKLKTYALNYGVDYVKSLKFLDEMDKLFVKILENLNSNDKKLSEYVPRELSEMLKIFVSKKTPNAASFIKSLPERFPDIDKKIDEFVYKIAKENFGSFLGLFLNYEQFYGKIKASAINYLEDPINQRFIAEKIKSFIDLFLQKEVKELSVNIPQKTIFGIVDGIDSFFQKVSREQLAENFLEVAEKKISQIDFMDILKKFVPNLSEVIKKALISIINSLINGLDNEKAANLKKTIINALTIIAEKGGSYVIKSMRFDKIIENKINSFSTKEMEDLVVSIADKELKMITALGGVLGFIIGFLPNILN